MSPKPKAKNYWQGAVVIKARRIVGQWIVDTGTKGYPCYRCSEPVFITDQWDVEHKVSISEGGNIFDHKNWAASHSKCNRRHGGLIGIVNRGKERRRLRDW